MPDEQDNGRLSPSAGRALCRLVRGVPGAAEDAALDDLVSLGLVSTVSAGECRDAARWSALAREAEGLREALHGMRAPNGVAALVPGATARFRKRAAEVQASLDALDGERREVERHYSAVRRAQWPLLPTAAPLPDGGRLLPTPDGHCAACAFWTSAGAIPALGTLSGSLARRAERASEVTRALAGGWKAPVETAWVCALLLGPETAPATLRRLHEWLARDQFWGSDPLPAAAILASSPDPGRAAQAAARHFESLRGCGYGVGALVFTAACRLAARPTWIEEGILVERLVWLLRRSDDLGLADQHRALPLLAPLACLPRSAGDLGQALSAIRATLRKRHPNAASTLEVAAVLLVGSGLYHQERHEGRSLHSRDDAAAQLLAGRYGAMGGPLGRMDGPSSGPGHRAELLAGVVALLPGPPEDALEVVAQARDALRGAGAPAEACRAPAALALAAACLGEGLGLHPREVAWELLTADAMARAAWSAKGPGGEVLPSFRFE